MRDDEPLCEGPDACPECNGFGGFYAGASGDGVTKRIADCKHCRATGVDPDYVEVEVPACCLEPSCVHQEVTRVW